MSIINDDSSKKEMFALGIDLGTTNTCACLINLSQKSDDPSLKYHDLDLLESNKCLPSRIYYRIADDELVAEIGITNDKEHEIEVYDIKRVLGKKYKDVEKLNLSFIKKNPENEMPEVEVFRKTIEPLVVSSHLLGYVKSKANDFIENKYNLKEGEYQINTVITVPANFNDTQRAQTKLACAFAGLNVISVLNEPTSAALYSAESDPELGDLLVFDLGGGTFDITVLRISKIDDKNFQTEVITTNGDPNLGGRDFDEAMFGVIYGLKKRGVNRMKKVEELKKALSDKISESIYVGEKYITYKRKNFDECWDPLFERIKICLENTYRNVMSRSKITRVIKVGGASKMHKIDKIIREILGNDIKISSEPDIFGVVARGAALYGSRIINKDPNIVKDIIPLSIGTDQVDGRFVPIIPRESSKGVRKTLSFATVYDNQEIMSIKLYQGEQTLASENKLLGTYMIKGLPKARAGAIIVDITLSVNDEYMLSVEAQAHYRGIPKNIPIGGDANPIDLNSDLYTPQQIEEMKIMAQAFAEHHKRRVEKSEEIYRLQKRIFAELRKKRDDIKLKEKLEKWIEETNAESIKNERLKEISSKLDELK